jgi:hypothetical protein
MRAVSRAGLLFGCGLLGACASSAYARWEAVRADPAYRAWASCIDDQAGLRMANALNPAPPAAEAMAAQGKTDGEVFVEILNACRQHMRGFGDNILHDRRNKRLLMDAYDQYRSIQSSIRAAEEAAII